MSYSESPINYKHFAIYFSSYSISFKSYGVLKLSEKGRLRDKMPNLLPLEIALEKRPFLAPVSEIFGYRCLGGCTRKNVTFLTTTSEIFGSTTVIEISLTCLKRK